MSETFPRQWLGFVLLYLLLNACTQYAVSPTADLDQAEQLVFSQDWRLGYSAQPPLYTWLVGGLFGIVGPGLAGLMAIKVGLLCLLAYLLLSLGRHLGFSANQHLIGLAGLAFVPQIIWESQRDLTHSVLATVAAAAILLQTARAARYRSTFDYALLGVLVGLGLLAKYNLVLFLGALIVAALAVPEYRRVLFDPRMGLTVLVASLVLAPHLMWVAGHLDIATSSSHKLQAGDGAALAGLGKTYLNALAFLSPLWLFALPMLVRGGRLETWRESADTRFLVALFLSILVVLGVFTLTTGASEIKDRWYLPLLFFSPLLVAALVRVQKPGWYVGLAMLLALVVAAVLPLRTLMADRFGRVERPNTPYSAHFDAIARQAGQPGIVAGETKLIGGNARLAFPDARIVADDYEFDGAVAGPWLVVCETEGCRGRFRDWLRERHGIDAAGLRFNRSAQPYRHSDRFSHTLHWAAVEAKR